MGDYNYNTGNILSKVCGLSDLDCLIPALTGHWNWCWDHSLHNKGYTNTHFFPSRVQHVGSKFPNQGLILCPQRWKHEALTNGALGIPWFETHLTAIKGYIFSRYRCHWLYVLLFWLYPTAFGIFSSPTRIESRNLAVRIGSLNRWDCQGIPDYMCS